ncbi:MAG: phosphoesterase [Alphaproteobacteria bacterium]|nr:MAG: phosphoesterase [Alphaproteobacteria bacterium]
MTEPLHPFWTRLPSGRETAQVAAIALGVGILTALVFTAWPGLDIAVSRLFLGADGVFDLTQPLFWRLLREAFMKGFTLWYVTIAVACVLALAGRHRLFGFGPRRWLYLAACSLAGPLLLVNILLKEHWGRWRPREIVELGGSEPFTSVLHWGGACDYNCSFVSGEVASMVMAFIALAFVTTAWRPVFYALTIVMGLVAALIRVGQGGHFLSDTLLAGVLMTIVAAALYWAIFLADAGRWLDRHDGLWARLCDGGLRLLDRLFPRRR